MARRLIVDQDVLANSSARLLTAAERLDQARGQLEGDLSTLGQCWGSSDEVAAQFARDYLPGRDEVIEGSRDLSRVLRGLGDRTRQAARTYAGVEQDNIANAQGGATPRPDA